MGSLSNILDRKWLRGECSGDGGEDEQTARLNGLKSRQTLTEFCGFNSHPLRTSPSQIFSDSPSVSTVSRQLAVILADWPVMRQMHNRALSLVCAVCSPAGNSLIAPRLTHPMFPEGGWSRFSPSHNLPPSPFAAFVRGHLYFSFATSQTEELLPPMPKRTFQPNRRRRSKTHGFRSRMKTKSGQAVLSRRRAKGRKRVSVKPGFRE